MKEIRYDVNSDMTVLLIDPIDSLLGEHITPFLEISAINSLIFDSVKLKDKQAILETKKNIGFYCINQLSIPEEIPNVINLLKGDVIFIDGNIRIITIFRNNKQIKHFFIYAKNEV